MHTIVELLGSQVVQNPDKAAVVMCQRQFKIDPLIDVIAEVKLTHPRN